MEYLPQIITAVATLGGVVLTLIFTGRRESKRVEQQLAFERDKLLADERRQLFVRTAHELQRMRERLNSREEDSERHGAVLWAGAVTKHADELFKLETEIRLLAPTLSNTVRAATQVARSIRDAPDSTSESAMDSLNKEFVRYTMSSMSKMRSILGTEPSDPSELTPAEQAMLKGMI